MRVSKLTAVCATLLLAALPPVSAHANVIYDNGGPNQEGGLYSDAALGITFADNFLLTPGNTTINDIHWWGLYFPGNAPGTDNFAVQIFADNNGAPEATPSILDINPGTANRISSGLIDDSGNTIYQYSLDISPVALSANTRYYVSIINDTTNNPDNYWLWAMADSYTGDGVWVTSDSPPTLYNSRDFAFNLTYTPVPEPASATLLGMGLLGIVVRRRRRT